MVNISKFVVYRHLNKMIVEAKSALIESVRKIFCHFSWLGLIPLTNIGMLVKITEKQWRKISHCPIWSTTKVFLDTCIEGTVLESIISADTTI